MELFFNKIKEEVYESAFTNQDIQRCPFLRNINKPTQFHFSSLNLSVPVPGTKGPIFEDGPNFDLAFKLFHGKDGAVPLARNFNHDSDDYPKSDPVPKFNPLAAKAATISLSAFGPGGPFNFSSFSNKWSKQKKSGTAKERDHASQGGNDGQHEAVGSEWLQTGNCPIAKSYRAVCHVLPLVAKGMRPPPGIKLRCPPAIVTARAALAQTALAKNLRPQPLPEKMFAIALLGMAANVPLGMWREHTQKFSMSWFVAVHAAVPFVAMLRKAVLMPKTAMALTIGASILGQAIGSKAERIRMKAVAARERTIEKEDPYNAEGYNPVQVNGIAVAHCGAQHTCNSTKDARSCSSGANIANICF